MTSLLCALVLALSSFSVFAEEIDSSYPNPPPPYVRTEKIKFLETFTLLPDSAWNYLKFSFQRDSVPVWSGIIASTALIYQYDADIHNWATARGRQWGLGNEDKTKSVLEVGPYPIFRFPSDTGSALYFLGDGWTHFAISAGFTLYGYSNDNTRAWNTGLEIFHGMFLSTVFNQALKRSIGHETPSQATTKRGQWKPFPSVKAYNTRTAKYDALPSGHLMTTTLVFNTIRLNYPEYEMYLLPTQILWSALLGYQMVNNGVHWASDYPLGIAMGWAAARMAVQMGKHNKDAAKKKEAANWMFFPSVGLDGESMMSARYSF